MFTLIFWKSVAERSVATFLETFLAVLVASGAATLTGADWLGALNVAGLALVIAVIKNVLVARFTDGSPSATGTEVVSSTGPFAG